MRTSEKTNELYTSKTKAQIDAGNVAVDAMGNYKNHYASLAATMDSIRPIYAKHGIAISQLTRLDGDVLMLVTRLSHTSGQYEEGEFPVCRFPARSQELGSAMTYARRYSILAACGIAPTDEPGEDDGQEANQTPIPAPKKSEKPKTISLMAAADSARERDTLLASLSLCTSKDAMLEWADKTEKLREQMHEADKQVLRDAFKDQQAALKGKAA
jgi:hypothetical protein